MRDMELARMYAAQAITENQAAIAANQAANAAKAAADAKLIEDRAQANRHAEYLCSALAKVKDSFNAEPDNPEKITIHYDPDYYYDDQLALIDISRTTRCRLYMTFTPSVLQVTPFISVPSEQYFFDITSVGNRCKYILTPQERRADPDEIRDYYLDDLVEFLFRLLFTPPSPD